MVLAFFRGHHLIGQIEDLAQFGAQVVVQVVGDVFPLPAQRQLVLHGFLPVEEFTPEEQVVPQQDQSPGGNDQASDEPPGTVIGFGDGDDDVNLFALDHIATDRYKVEVMGFVVGELEVQEIVAIKAGPGITRISFVFKE